VSCDGSQFEGESIHTKSDLRSKRLGRELEDSTCGPNASQFVSQNSSRYSKLSGSVLDGTDFQMKTYFGDSSRVEFFDRLHYLSAKRGVVHRGRKPILFGDEQRVLNQLIRTDPYASKTSSESLNDYPFAPHRQDEDFEEGGGDGAGAEANDDHIGNHQTDSYFASYENSSRDSLSTTALLVPYDEGCDLSPRTKYLNGCLAKEINPRASLILRKNVSTVLNLQHHGMGDQHGVIFAEALRDLPMIHTINLSDNNLTDISLSPIIESIIAIPSVTNVDLSQNKVDGQCSRALASYLRTPSCSLRRLVLKSADIDDTEADHFVKSLMNNSTLQELDLSHNLIGRAETLNTVRPEFNTGAEALALLLQSENSHLETLCLSWNMIRLDSAVSLTSSLGSNLYLRYLDLSYNSLGEMGGEYLGKSLLTNNTLQTLLINHNNLTSAACFTICVGIEENYSLKRVNMDGNPIGEAGAKSLTQIPVAVGGRVKVSASGCNLEVKYDKDRLFNPYDPCGSYALNCDDCYHRAIAFKILRTLASNPGYSTLLFSWSPHPLPPLEKLKPPPPPPMRNNPTKAELMLMQRRVPTMIPPPSASSVKITRDIQRFDWKDLDEVKRTTLEGLLHLQAAAKNVSYAKDLFAEFDRDQSGALDIDELMKLLTTLGVSTDRADVALAISRSVTPPSVLL
jgi:Ran GTPase-activating protein (RanGAP) involved in mRNA processing and transport